MSNSIHSQMFEDLKNRYDYSFVRIDQLRKYVELNKITLEEFKEITGIDY